MFRLYYWFAGVNQNRAGGPWWPQIHIRSGAMNCLWSEVVGGAVHL